MLAKEDGSEFRQREVAGPSSEAVDLGTRLAEELLEGARTHGRAAS